MRFNPALLDEIRARIPVSQVVAKRVNLKRNGREFVGLSPFKQEKTPSFTVNDQKGFYHCFASGEHGDIFTFVMKTEGLSFPEAVEQLAGEAGVDMPKPTAEDIEVHDERERLYGVMEAAAIFFEACLGQGQGRHASDYLESRGLSRQTRRLFRLGFGPNDRNALKNALRGQGFDDKDMVRAGLVVSGPDIAQPYDRFRNRIMYPICDLQQRVVAFGARALDAAQTAKYLNSPETPLFHKGAMLFNAARARTASHNSESVIVVEGYMDVIALSQAGLENTVAPLGTALTEQQIKLLWRMAPEPTLCFDGDAAGRKAAYRSIDNVLAHLKPGYSLKYAFLPDGLDPDDLIREQGAEALSGVLAKAAPLVQMLWRREVEQGDWQTPEQRAQLEANLRRAVDQIGDESVRKHYHRAVNDRLIKQWRPQWQKSKPHGRARPTRGGAHRGSDRSPYGAVNTGQTTSLLQSKLAQAGTAPPAGREALLLCTLLNHPWLIDEYVDEIAELELNNIGEARLRDALLEVHAEQNPLDSDLLHAHLARLGLEKSMNTTTDAVLRRGDRFARPDACQHDVRVGWQHTLALHRKKVGLEKALRMAETEFRSDLTQASYEQIVSIRNELEALDGREAYIEGYGDGGSSTRVAS